MTLPISLYFQNTFNSTKAYLSSISSEWAGRVVIKLKSGLIYLEDLRVAGATIFLVNFGILELAARIAQLTCLCMPKQTETQQHVRSALQTTLASGLTLAGNIAFVRATRISINPFMIAAIVMVTFVTKYSLQSYINYQPIADKG